MYGSHDVDSADGLSRASLNARNFLAGGVNSPIPTPSEYPKYVVSGEGPYILDNAGNRYIDLWMGYGALLRGHRDPVVEAAIGGVLHDGWFFSLPRVDEIELSAVLHDLIPCAERVRFATTGSDAVLYAVRAARAYTGRHRIVVIRGGYHGAHLGNLPSAGMLPGNEEQFEWVAFNDLEAAQRVIASCDFAAILLEPVQANNGCVPPESGYLEGLRRICSETGTVLIFDEIVTGFRLGLGGAQGKFGVIPDICTLSKAIAGGFPLSAVCGKKELLDQFTPSGKVLFAGTFNAHPVSLRVALRNIASLQSEFPYDHMDDLGQRLREHIRHTCTKYGLKVAVQGVGSMLSIAFGVDHFRFGLSETAWDGEAFAHFIQALAAKGVLYPPLPTETVFLSPAHESVFDHLEKAFSYAIEKVAERSDAAHS